MKNKLIACAVTVFTVGSMLPGFAAATDGSAATPDSTPAGPPAACIEPLKPLDPPGPARAPHSETIDDNAELPICSDVEGICVEVNFPAPGPARAAHRPEVDVEVDTTEVPCTPIDPSCDIVVDVDVDITGPARAAHQPAGEEPLVKGYLVEIPEQCLEALSLAALPDSGSDSATIMWLGAALVLIGGALVLTRRTALVRSR